MSVSPNVKIQIFLSGTTYGYLDLRDDLPISLNYSIAEIQDISKKNSSFSKTIVLPATRNNNKILGHLFDINLTSSSFDINRKYNAVILANEIPQLRGFLQLTSVKKISKTSILDEQNIQYEIVLFDNKVSFYDKLGDSYLSDLDFSQYNHTLSFSSITASSSHTFTEVYKYPMLWNQNQAFYQTNDFRPGIFAKAYLNKISETKGITFSGDILESEPFTKLIIPYNGDSATIISSEANRRSWKAHISGSTDRLITSGSSQLIGLGSVLHSKIPFNAEDSDSANTYNNSSYVFTSDRNQNFDLSVNYQFYFRIVPNTSYSGTLYSNPVQNSTPFYVWNEVLKNGSVQSAVVSDTLTTPPSSFSGSYTSNLFNFNYVFNISDLPAGALIGDYFETFFNFGIGGGNNFFSSSTTFNSSTYVPTRIEFYAVALPSGSSASDFNRYQMTPHIVDSFIDGEPIYLNDFIPRQIKQKDFFSSLVNMFNLYIETNPDNENELIVKTREQYYSGDTYLDWTYKFAQDYEHGFKFLTELQNKELLFTYRAETSDSDLWNKRFTDSTNQIYGQELVKFENEFLTGRKSTEIIFSPTPLVENLLNPPMVVPGIVSQSPKNNIRILYDGGQVEYPAGWTFLYNQGGVSASTVLTAYTYCGHFDDFRSPTLDINFGSTPFLFYNSFDNITSNNLYNNYWSTYVNDIANGKLFSAYFKLEEKDILNLKLSDKIFVKDSFYYINRILDYNPVQPSLTKVELIKINRGIRFFGKSKAISRPVSVQDVKNYTQMERSMMTRPFDFSSIKSGIDISLVGSGNIVRGQEVSVVGSSNNISGLRTGSINGQRNVSSGFTQNLNIFGDNNIISSSIGGNNFISGNNNYIPTGITGVNLFGDNITADTSNTVYVDNIQIFSSITLSSDATIVLTGTTLDIWSSSTGSNSIIANNYTGNYVGSPFGNILGGSGNYIN